MAAEPLSQTTFLIELEHQRTLDSMIQLVLDRAAVLLSVPRVSVRIFDNTRTYLLPFSRLGTPLHRKTGTKFKSGEGLIGWVAAHEKPLLLGDAEKDPRFLSRPDMLERMGSFLGVPLISNGECFGVLSTVHPENEYFLPSHLEILQVLAQFCVPHPNLLSLMSRSVVDPVTGALSSRGIELAFSQRGSVPPAVVRLAIDRKDPNIEPAEEEIRWVSQCLSDRLYTGDAILHAGGGDFLLVFPSLTKKEAAQVVETVRGFLEKNPPQGATLTISAGVATLQREEKRDALLERASLSLRKAIEAGGNQILTEE